MGLEIKIKDREELEAYYKSFSSLLTETEEKVNILKIRHSNLRRYNEIKKGLLDLRNRFSEDTQQYFSKLELIDELIKSEEYEKIKEVNSSILNYEKILGSHWRKLRRGIYEFVREKDRLKTNYVLETLKINPIKFENWEKFG